MELLQRIELELKMKERVLIAIDGPCASGKSTFASWLQDKVNGTLFHMDDFFLPEVLKTEARLNEIGGNVYYERFEQEILQNVSNSNIEYQKFNCKIQALEDPLQIPLKEVVIVEGSYSLHRRLRDYYDIKVMLEVDPMLQLERLKKRAPEHLYKRFINEWIPLENKYFEQEQLHTIADFIIDTKKLDS